MWVVQDQRTPHKRPWQGRGSSKLKLRSPPGLGGHVESAGRESYIETGAGKQTVVYSAGFGPRDEEICTFITVLPNCELAENEHLSPQDARRELAVARTSRSRRPHRCRVARPQIFKFLGKKVVYPPANLGASSTNFQSR